MKQVPRKLRLAVRSHFAHHRCGWSWVEDGIADALGSDGAPTLLVGALEHHLGHSKQPLAGPWVGISHHAMDVLPGVENAYASKPVSLRHYRDLIVASLSGCRGIFTLSERMRICLRELLHPAEVRIESLLHPTPLDVLQFSWERFEQQPRAKIIQLGHHFRQFHAIYKLPTTRFDKVWLPGKKFDISHALRAEGKLSGSDNSVLTPGRVNNEEYDVLLSQSLALVPLYDASACNSLLECIARATPVLVNPLPAVEEYVGREYPLYFRTLEEASRKAEDTTAVKAAHHYLCGLDKTQFARDRFVESLAESEIYHALPLPSNT